MLPRRMIFGNPGDSREMSPKRSLEKILRFLALSNLPVERSWALFARRWHRVLENQRFTCPTPPEALSDTAARQRPKCGCRGRGSGPKWGLIRICRGERV